MPPRDLIKEAVAENDKPSYSKSEVLNLLSSLEAEHDGCEVETICRGDVFWHKVVGGKMRPWVVINVRDDLVSAVAMSSGDSAPRMLQARCRFWSGRWIGATATLVDAENARKCVTRPYTDQEHLREIEAHVAGLLGLRSKKAGKSA